MKNKASSIFKNQIEKPQKRGKFRKILGREYFILKRKMQWLKNYKNFAKADASVNLPYSVMKHKSLLLRPLKDVDMYLQKNKITNLQIAISHINNVVIKPNQTFSVWRMVGRPKKYKGYFDGLVLENGKISKGTGGGLCQLGNLLYWLALHTSLTISERWRHSYDVFPDINRTIPFASGATLSYNYIDLQLFNNTNATFQIKLWLDDEYLNGEILCNEKPAAKYEIFETDHCFEHQWWGGYTRHNKIWKRIIDVSDGTTTQELIAENAAIMMYNPMLENK